jgi:SET domain-containing protein
MLVLRPSRIAGVGVFTTQPIAEGEHLRLWQEEDWRLVPYAEAENNPEMREVGEIYCVRTAEGYSCPADFHRMSIGWYMNHSDAPNVASSKDLGFEYFATRDIAAGEEIFCDYRALSPEEEGTPDDWGGAAGQALDLPSA